MAGKYRIDPAVATASRRVSGLGHRQDPDDPDLAEARRELRFLRFREQCREAAANDPDFTAEQWAILGRVFFGGTDEAVS